MSEKLTLAQVEADIALCEEYLARDTDSQDDLLAGAGTPVVSGPARQSPARSTTSAYARGSPGVTPVRKAAASPAVGNATATGTSSVTSHRHLTDSRRNEILDRLQKERLQRQQGGGASGDGMSQTMPARRSAPVVAQHNLGNTVGTPVNQKRKAARDQLIARLLNERRGGGGDVSTSTSPAKGDAWSLNQSGIIQGGHAGDDVGDGPFEYTSPRSVKKQQQRGASSASRPRPQSAPRQRPAPQSASRTANRSSMKRASLGFDRTTTPKRTGNASARKRPASAPRTRPAPGEPARHAPGSRAETMARLTRSVQQSREEAKAVQIAREMAECTFKPKINKNTPWDGGRKLSRQERIERLAQHKKDKWKADEEKRALKEQREVQECTFKPKIHKAPKSVYHAESVGGGDPFNALGGGSADASRLRERSGKVEDRLHHEADRRAEAREQRKRAMEEEEFERLTFRPKINAKSQAIAQSREARPVHERVGELQRQRHAKLHQLRVEREEEQELTFRPQLDPVSEQLASSRRSSQLEVVERLSRAAQLTVHNRYHTRQDIEREAAEERTHRPQINEVSAKIAENLEEFQGPTKDFLARQAAYEQRKKERLNRRLSQSQAEASFHPQISGVSELLIQSKPSRAGETFLEKVERLAHKDKEHAQRLRQQMEEDYYAKYTFKPKINKISKVIGQKTNLHELHRNNRNESIKAQASKAAEKAYQKTHTFKPRLNRKSAKIAAQNESRHALDYNDPTSIMSRITEYKTARQHRLDETRKALEYNEMKGCSFEPRLETKEKPIHQSDGPVLVPGLGRHLELMELAKRKVEEQQEREDEVFGRKRKGRDHNASDSLYTVPQPFNLSVDPKAHLKRARIRQEALVAELSECTFQPQTNERTRRELIQEIMDDNSGAGYRRGKQGGSASADGSTYCEIHSGFEGR